MNLVHSLPQAKSGLSRISLRILGKELRQMQSRKGSSRKRTTLEGILLNIRRALTLSINRCGIEGIVAERFIYKKYITSYHLLCQYNFL